MNNKTAPVPRPGVLKINPYVQGASEIAGAKPKRPLIKLSSNESSFGPSPLARAAYADAVNQVHRYPDGSQRALREAIGQVHNLDPNHIICGNGSDELIQLVMRAYVGDGDEVVLSENGFLMCAIHANAQGATVVTAPETGDRVDADAILALVNERTRLVTIANPNNPTGTYLNADEIAYLHERLPPSVVFLLDCAYAEFATASDYNAGADLVEGSHNVVMTRTFSKIYGLSSLRIGWAYLPHTMVDPIQRIRTPFNANGPAMATAVAAVLDQDYILKLREHNARWLEVIHRNLTALGLYVVPSQANFYLVRFPASCGVTADSAEKHLHEAGIIPRPVAGAGDQELRITVGLDEENQAVLDAFASLLGHSTTATPDSAHG